MEKQQMRVTFDTNMVNIIHDPGKYAQHTSPDDARTIKDAMIDGRVQGFVSGASAFVECLSFPDKLAYFAVVLTPDPRPTPDSRMIARFECLASIGVAMLRAPLIGAEKFIDGVPWADDKIYSPEERHNRFSSFSRCYRRHHPLVEYGKELAKNQPPIPPRRRITTSSSNRHIVPMPQKWAIAIKREWDENPEAQKQLRKFVGPIIGEWCDCLILGSHFAYGNDVFCTIDKGRNAGIGSILHQENREKLAKKGVKIVSPQELALLLEG